MKTIVLCGAGGYGEYYANELLKIDNSDLKWVGTIQPSPDRVEIKDKIDDAGVPWFKTLEEFYSNNTADLCIVASPIAFHSPQSITALNNGSNVLCEKPVAALPSEVAAMIKARDDAGKFLGIGYQWSYTKAIQKIKQDISSGKGIYGKPLRLRSLILCSRDTDYYTRSSGWAGRMRDNSGRWVLDSVANNATAHFLHNMLYILGEPGRSVMPDTTTAILMRANPIEMYDTAFIQMKYNDTDISFIASHAGDGLEEFLFRYEFENGVITCDKYNGCFTGTLNSGEVIDYGSTNEEPICPIWKVIDSLQGKNDLGFCCPIDAALPHNHVMIAALLSSEIGAFPKIENDGKRFYKKGLDDICLKCNEEMSFPNYDWAKPGRAIRMDDPEIMLYGKS